jgi:hypothetical protein
MHWEHVHGDTVTNKRNFAGGNASGTHVGCVQQQAATQHDHRVPLECFVTHLLGVDAGIAEW